MSDMTLYYGFFLLGILVSMVVLKFFHGFSHGGKGKDGLDVNADDLKKKTEEAEHAKQITLEILEDVQNEKMHVSSLLQRLELATKSAKIGIWEWDVKKNIITWDDRMYALYGVTRETFAGAYDAWRNGLHPDDKEKGDKAIQMALSGEKEFDTSFRVVWPDKSIHYIKAYGLVERDGAGAAEKMIGVNWDVTKEKKEAEQKEIFEAIVRDTNDAVITEGFDAIVRSWNPSAESLYGYTAKEMIGTSVRVIVPEEYDDLDVLLKKVKTGEPVSNHRTKRKRKNGTLLDVSLTFSPIRNSEGIVEATSVVARDISHDIEIERMKQEFVSIASHELRTPLTVIDGLVSMIRTGEYGPINEKLSRPLEDINTSSSRLIQLVNDLLSVSRLSSGKMAYAYKDVDICAVIHETIRILGHIADTRGITLEIVECSPLTVYADEEKVKQIIHNLVGNAIKFTDHGKIMISCVQKDHQCIVSIADTGVGISESDRKKLFLKFQQLDSGTGRPMGTGLGLYISKELCMNMGGDIWLSSSEKGKGSVFSFSLPLDKEAKDQLVQDSRRKEEAHV